MRISRSYKICTIDDICLCFRIVSYLDISNIVSILELNQWEMFSTPFFILSLFYIILKVIINFHRKGAVVRN